MNNGSDEVMLSVPFTLDEIRNLVSSYATSRGVLPKIFNGVTPLSKIIEEAKTYCVLEIGDIVSWSEHDIDERFSVKSIEEDRVTLQVLDSSAELTVDLAEIDFVTNNSSYQVIKADDDFDTAEALANL